MKCTNRCKPFRSNKNTKHDSKAQGRRGLDTVTAAVHLPRLEHDDVRHEEDDEQANVELQLCAADGEEEECSDVERNKQPECLRPERVRAWLVLIHPHALKSDHNTSTEREFGITSSHQDRQNMHGAWFVSISNQRGRPGSCIPCKSLV